MITCLKRKSVMSNSKSERTLLDKAGYHKKENPVSEVVKSGAVLMRRSWNFTDTGSDGEKTNNYLSHIECSATTYDLGGKTGSSTSEKK